MTLATRLRALERPAAAEPREHTVAIYFHDELVPCTSHPGCDFEPATGKHHEGVIHLELEVAQAKVQ